MKNINSKLFEKMQGFTELITDECHITVFRHFRTSLPEISSSEEHTRIDEEMLKRCGGQSFDRLLLKIKIAMIETFQNPLGNLDEEDLENEEIYIEYLSSGIESILKIDKLYQYVVDFCDVLHEYSPSTMLSIYRQSFTLKEDVAEVLDSPFDFFDREDIYHSRSIISMLISSIRSCWMNYPEFLFKIPTDIVEPILIEMSEEVLKNPRCFEIIKGVKKLSGWIHPPIVDWIHEKRLVYQTEKWTILLKSFFRDSIPEEVCSIIASFMNIQRMDRFSPMRLEDLICDKVYDGWIDVEPYGDETMEIVHLIE